MAADSSKFGKASLLKICPLTEVDEIITDSGLDHATATAIRSMGVEQILA